MIGIINREIGLVLGAITSGGRYTNNIIHVVLC